MKKTTRKLRLCHCYCDIWQLQLFRHFNTSISLMFAANIHIHVCNNKLSSSLYAEKISFLLFSCQPFLRIFFTGESPKQKVKKYFETLFGTFIQSPLLHMQCVYEVSQPNSEFSKILTCLEHYELAQCQYVDNFTQDS